MPDYPMPEHALPEYCTCGTTLVENARFCHRCGRPTSAEAAAFEETPPPLPVTPIIQLAGDPRAKLQAKLAQLPVSFSNPIALRVAFLISLAIIPLELAPLLSSFSVVWWLAAGCGAVMLYRKLTGSSLTVGAGARLGSITGVLTFASLAIGFCVTVLLTGKQFFDELDQVMAQAMKQNPEAARAMHDPTMIFIFLLFCLGILGVLVVGMCAAGGALGARFTARKVEG
jgi:hypothetical protein